MPCFEFAILAKVKNQVVESRTGQARHRIQQAAAVCYRRVDDAIQFLLVGTNGGKWTFPKGYIDGVSDRESALREALEEGGAIGDIAQKPFCAYLHSKGVFWKGEPQEFMVQAFLMEVLFTVSPAEQLRNPTWFSAEAAKQKLSQGRELKYQRELHAVVEKALLEIDGKPQSDRRRVG